MKNKDKQDLALAIYYLGLVSLVSISYTTNRIEIDIIVAAATIGMLLLYITTINKLQKQNEKHE